MSSTSVAFNRVQSFNSSDQDAFDDARRNAEPDFAIYTASAAHSLYLDPNKVQRLSGSLRWIIPDERLVPAKMTAFGGLYTVRGYDEYEFVADGGVLASLQYEFDLVQYYKDKGTEPNEAYIESEPNKPAMPEKLQLRKLAPLFFLDYAHARNKNHVDGEPSDEELASWGVGTIVELGDNFTGAVYYGYPLMATEDTREGKGRMNVSLMLRF
jgi:hemolysin activation/secretion protein